MRLRGEKAVILTAVHRDKDHVHIHACVSALEYRTGRSIRLSKAQLHELKTAFQRYHERHHPGLTRSLPEHGSGRPYVRDTTRRIQQRESVIAIVRDCLARATTQSGFLDLLRDKGLNHYERGGTAAGVEHKGVRYRFARLLDGDGFDALPIERAEEDRVLAAIRAVRERQRERDERDRNIGDREW